MHVRYRRHSMMAVAACCAALSLFTPAEARQAPPLLSSADPAGTASHFTLPHSLTARFQHHAHAAQRHRHQQRRVAPRVAPVVSATPTATQVPPATHTATPTPPATATPAPTSTPLPSGAPGDVHAAIAAAAARWHVSYGWLLGVATCESGLNPRAYNPSSGASGLFQFIPGTYYSYAAHIGETRSIWDPYGSADVAAYMFSIGQAYQWTCR